jgi:hypothetical protein
MTLRSFLAVDIPDGAATESLLRAGIEQAGGVVEECNSRIAPRGGREVVFTLKTVPVEVLHHIMRKVEEVPGISVRSVSQHSRP